MASFAEIGSPKAEEKRHWAAKVALPIDLRFAMDFTVSCACSIGFELAVFADEAVFLSAFLDALLLLAINHATKVRFLAFKALIEGAGVKCKAL